MEPTGKAKAAIAFSVMLSANAVFDGWLASISDPSELFVFVGGRTSFVLRRPSRTDERTRVHLHRIRHIHPAVSDRDVEW